MSSKRVFSLRYYLNKIFNLQFKYKKAILFFERDAILTEMDKNAFKISVNYPEYAEHGIIKNKKYADYFKKV